MSKINKINVGLFTRVSTADQSTERQISDLRTVANTKGYEVVKSYNETLSGATKTAERPVLKQAINDAKKGKFDILMFSELSRLGRNSREVLNALGELHEVGCNIFIQQFGIYTLNSNGEKDIFASFFVQMLTAFSEMERETLRDRILSGQKQARINAEKAGKKFNIGRPKKAESTDKFLAKHPEVIRLIKVGGLSQRQIMKMTGKGLGTITKVKKAIEGK